MELPHGILSEIGSPKEKVLKLIRNIYGQKQAGRVWNQYLVKKLHDIGFEPSSIDESVFLQRTLYIYCVRG